LASKNIAFFNLQKFCHVFAGGLTSQSSNQPGTNQRLFRSLAVIILVNIGGYFYVSIMRAFVLPQFRLNSIVEWYFNSYDGILLNVSAAANAPILYFLRFLLHLSIHVEISKGKMAFGKMALYRKMTKCQ
jgi:hypothetical protein